MVTSTALAALPFRIRPLNNIAGFTYRDGTSHVELLEKLRVYVNENLRVEFNEELARIIDDFNNGVEGWTDAFNEFILEMTEHIAELNKDGISLALADMFTNPANAPYNVDFTGNTDPEVVAANTAGMQAALNKTGFINCPAGTCVISGDLSIPSRTHVGGQGEENTIFKIADTAGWNERGFIFQPGTEHSSLNSLTVDGNYGPRNKLDGLGGIRGTNVSVVNSKHIRIEKVTSKNAMQHCFDVTTPLYNAIGDGPTVPNPSEYVDLIDCTADQYGDDGFTTHGSRRINFTRCKAMGTRYGQEMSYINSNGFEADDYSYDITFTDCYARKSAHGFEIKAHGTMSAARNVRMVGCFAEYNQCNYSLRHIGHHSAGDTLSATAKNVQIIGCTSRFPDRVFFGGTDGLDGDVPDDQTPQGQAYSHVVIGAYRGVEFSNFTMISDPTFNYAGAPAFLIHFRAEDIVLNGYHISGHTTGSFDIHATGGDRGARNVTIINGVHKDSAPNVMSTGAAAAATIQNIFISRNVPNSPNVRGIIAYGNKIVRNIRFDSEAPAFQYPYQMSYTYYSVYETPLATNVTMAGPPA